MLANNEIPLTKYGDFKWKKIRNSKVFVIKKFQIIFRPCYLQSFFKRKMENFGHKKSLESYISSIKMWGLSLISINGQCIKFNGIIYFLN